MHSYLLGFVIALACSLVLTRLARQLARRLGWTDQPDKVRKRHALPIPAAGGVAIYAALLISVGVIGLLPTRIGALLRADLQRLLVILGLSGLLMLLGLFDDLKGISPWKKFGAESVIAIICWGMGFQITTGWTSQGSVFSVGVLSLPLTLVWIVGITNAFNLIDGMDGLSSGAALFAIVALLGASLVGNHGLCILLLSAMAGATLGFLRYNFNPASIFLGDSGSLLLGFMLSLIAIESSQKSSAAIAIGVPIVAFGLPVIDTAVTIIRRFISGKPIFVGDCRHIHHMLLARGLTPKTAAVLLYGVCALFGLISLLFLNPSGRMLGLGLTVLAICVWFGIQQLRYPELRDLNAHFARGIQHQRRLIAGSVQVGRMIDGFRSAGSLAKILENLAAVLGEMEFSRAEVLFPCTNEADHNTGIEPWLHIRESETHCLFKWVSEGEDDTRRSGRRDIAAGRRTLGDEFKLEYVFEFPNLLPAPPFDRRTFYFLPEQPPVGRIAFYHPVDTAYPVSAISLLSQDIWQEICAAMVQIMDRQGPSCQEPALPIQATVVERYSDDFALEPAAALHWLETCE
jgi:UDP-GlcNAc:undecaprenyl-phosphate GlcNAc-1-phosphate transferase